MGTQEWVEPRQYSRVKMEHPTEYKYVVHAKDLHMNWFIYMGEIPNMPGHCVVAGYTTGKLYSGLHTDNFVEVED